MDEFEVGRKEVLIGLGVAAAGYLSLRVVEGVIGKLVDRRIDKRFNGV